MSGPAPARRYTRPRARLVELLRDRGIRDEEVLRAIGTVPRHEFVDAALQSRAYHDEALPIGYRQTISQPFTVAYQTSLLEVGPGDRVLEIGTGSGYQASVLAEMGVKVYSIERVEPLYRRTRERLKRLGSRVRTRCGDGTRGWPAFAPFDAIIVTAGAPVVPEALLEQLRVPDDETRGGRLVIPVGDRSGQRMNRFERLGDERYEQEVLDGFSFVPLIGDG